MSARGRSQAEVDLAIVALWRTGMSVRSIARTLDVARARIHRAIERSRARALPTPEAFIEDEGRKT